ncbi:hypothetical protein R1sor_027069 [Riccia sorocarpa]|uniref:CCHC-type domain-containing protein n=1 Tax=Riccia sorocarpa TaxID=122646 RepID=A0ABD3GEP6_9MARC
MVYSTPWEPGFDTNKVLTKKMACWLDLANVDPLIEDEATCMLNTLGEVVRIASVTEKQEDKYPNIRGCILMDMTKPLPTVMKIILNNEVKRVQIQYDVLPDACYTCHKRGHFARFCPLTTKEKKEPQPQSRDKEETTGDNTNEVEEDNNSRGEAKEKTVDLNE